MGAVFSGVPSGPKYPTSTSAPSGASASITFVYPKLTFAAVTACQQEEQTKNEGEADERTDGKIPCQKNGSEGDNWARASAGHSYFFAMLLKLKSGQA
jgi:hypothetical protein